MAAGRNVDRKDLLRGYLQCFEEEYFYALEHGFDRSLDYCRQYTATLGRAVEVDDGKKVYRGEAVAIADDGALIIDHDGQQTRVIAGDVQPLFDRDGPDSW
jgi:BirA family biotin operon repressor/biotin-[acetyl-CoA-carboxylase] ligase